MRKKSAECLPKDRSGEDKLQSSFLKSTRSSPLSVAMRAKLPLAFGGIPCATAS